MNSILKNQKGSFTVEATLVIPLVIIVICALLTINIFFFSKVNEYENIVREKAPDYCSVHRGVSAVFDAGGDIYEILFGGED